MYKFENSNLVDSLKLRFALHEVEEGKFYSSFWPPTLKELQDRRKLF